MADVLLFPEWEKRSSEMGQKTQVLARLSERGFLIPESVALPSSVVSRAFEGGDLGFSTVAEQVLEILPAGSYAVRSSALGEDGRQESRAGEFQTLLDVSPEVLAKALFEVTQHAAGVLGGAVEQFSILVQEFIAADRSGVVFTRDPLGSGMMILETVLGRGDQLVSGQKTPQRQVFLSHELPVEMRDFQVLEELFEWPQDVEFCEKAGQRYFLQSRPLTTISEGYVKACLAGDEYLRAHPGLQLYQNALTEAIPRPAPLTMDMLKDLYAKGGVCDQVYRSLGMRYQHRSTFHLVEGRLFVDPDAELCTLCPAFGFSDGRPRWVRLQGSFVSFKNLWRIHRLEVSALEGLAERLKHSLNRELQETSFQDAYTAFFEEYGLVYEVGILAEKAVRDLENALKSESVGLAEVLSHDFGEDYSALFQWKFPSEGLMGNSLDFMDQTAFSFHEGGFSQLSTVDEWWSHLSTVRKKRLSSRIFWAQYGQLMKERARWLTVVMLNRLRGILEQQLRDPSLLPFLRLEEAFCELPSPAVLERRLQIYQSQADLSFPTRLGFPEDLSLQSSRFVVSPGEAQGVLVSADAWYDQSQGILLVETLTPDLFQRFPGVLGIVAERGGILSHLGILARERGIPVVSGCSRSEMDSFLGKEVVMGSPPKLIDFVE